MKPTEETKKKDTVRISKKDLLKLLSENEHMTKQVKELQGRMNEMLEEIRALKAEKVAVPPEPEITPKELTPEDIEKILKPQHHNHYPSHPRSDIYFDGK
jgi:hypothetical protein